MQYSALNLYICLHTFLNEGPAVIIKVTMIAGEREYIEPSLLLLRVLAEVILVNSWEFP